MEVRVTRADWVVQAINVFICHYLLNVVIEDEATTNVT
jgi:hypothetical protein